MPDDSFAAYMLRRRDLHTLRGPRDEACIDEAARSVKRGVTGNIERLSLAEVVPGVVDHSDRVCRNGPLLPYPRRIVVVVVDPRVIHHFVGVAAGGTVRVYHHAVSLCSWACVERSP
jgi:hypothetical protein